MYILLQWNIGGHPQAQADRLGRFYPWMIGRYDTGLFCDFVNRHRCQFRSLDRHHASGFAPVDKVNRLDAESRGQDSVES